MKKYNKYGHHKKKRWRSCTLQFIIDFTSKHKKKGSEVTIWISPGKYSEDLILSNSVGIMGTFDEQQRFNSPLVVKEAKWPPKIIQKEL